MSLRNKTVLLTYGPTWVAIDEVRVLSNISSGTMGQKIIKALKAKGAKVTALEGPLTCNAKVRAHKTYKYKFFQELKRLLTSQLKKNYDVVIHAAAVADFQLKDPARGKVSSQKNRLKLTLVKTEKLINRIKKHRPATCLVGFKLETDQHPPILKKKVKQLIKDACCDLVVANTAGKTYRSCIFNNNLDILARAQDRITTSRQLANILNKTL